MLPNPFMPITKIGQNIAWCWYAPMPRQASDVQPGLGSANGVVNGSNSQARSEKGDQAVAQPA